MSSTARVDGASGAKSGLSVNLRMVAMPCWAMPRMSSKSWSSWRAVSRSLVAKDCVSNGCSLETGHVRIKSKKWVLSQTVAKEKAGAFPLSAR